MNSPFPPPDALQRSYAMAKAAELAGRFAFEHAAAVDVDGAFPSREIAELRRLDLLTALLPRQWGGAEPEPLTLAGALRRIGAGSLPLGRLYEGHVNALGLLLRYGAPEQVARAARDAHEGLLFGVWNTDDAAGLRLTRERGGWRLDGRKILASGAGRVARALVTANDEAGRRLMVIPRLDGAERGDLSAWIAHGMRGSATGAFDFTGLMVAPEDVLGGDGDYERQPYFSGGAWRFCAVQQGGMERLLDLLRAHLARTGRGGDPHQAARLGDAAIAVETARLWVERAAETAEAASADPERVVAYVNLARIAVERGGLALMELVQRSVGLQSFMRANPIERVARDLATYLRQPAPDRALTHAASYVLTARGEAHRLWA